MATKKVDLKRDLKKNIIYLIGNKPVCFEDWLLEVSKLNKQEFYSVLAQFDNKTNLN